MMIHVMGFKMVCSCHKDLTALALFVPFFPTPLSHSRPMVDIDSFRCSRKSAHSSSQRKSSVPAAPKPWKDLLQSPGHPEVPLRLLIVGHNPSSASYNAGHYYANPSNHFYRLMIAAGLVPPGTTAENDRSFPAEYGIGFTDLWQVQGSDSNEVQRIWKKGDWRDAFYQRLRDHEKRAGGRPKVVAFTGKGIFGALCGISGGVKHGRQTRRPAGWPWGTDSDPDGVGVFVLSSPSGRAGMKMEAREVPYRALGRLVREYDWPLVRKRKQEYLEYDTQKKAKGDICKNWED